MKKLLSNVKPGIISLLFIFLSGLFSLAYSAPSIAPARQEFLDYINNLKNGKVNKITTQGHHMGLVPSPIDFSHMKGQRIARRFRAGTVNGLNSLGGPALGGGPYPAAYDLRPLGKLTSVKDQGSYDTCWSFATFGSMESCLMPAEPRNFSEKNLVNLAGFDWGEATGGNAAMSTAYLARWGGPVNESDDPYPSNAGGWTTSAAGLQVQKHIQEVLYIPERSGPTDNDNIKEMVMDYGAVMTSMYMDDNTSHGYLNASLTTNTTAYYFNVSGATANHAVAIVGWDDNYSASNFHFAPSGNGAFIIKNSWGTAWGNNGYFYISYYDSKAMTDNTVFEDAESTGNYYHNYQYDPLGAIGTYGYGSNTTAWFSNIFTAISNEELSAVGFYTPSMNASYTIKIYNSFNGSSFSGLLESQSGTMPIAGYHTIALNSLVPIASCGKICVVVQLTTPGYIHPISIEYPWPTYSSLATASAGQSYISSDGATWSDMTTLVSNTNVCLKVYTILPTVTSITPNTGRNTGPLSITNLAGTGFVTGASAKLVKPGQSDIDATGVTVVSPAQITCSFDLNGKAPGVWNVTVSTGGPGSISATLINGFVVVSSITVDSITPNSGINSGPVSITNLTGAGFVNGSTAQLAKAGQSPVAATAVNVLNPSQITCAFNLTGLAVGYWDVIVATGGPGSTTATLANGFLVNPMALTSITPNTGINNGPLNITSLSGSGFVNGSAVQLAMAGQSPVNAGAVNVVNPNKITCTLNLTGLAIGYWDVIVSTGWPGSLSATLAGGLWVVNTITVTGITPNNAVNSGSVSITNLAGAGFVNGSTVQLAKAGQSPVAASAVSVVNPSQITCAFNLTALTTGYWNVVVSTGGPGSTSATLVDCFLVNPAVITPEALGLISGKVTKIDGITAVPGTVLTALQSGTTVARSISDISGNYSMQVAAGIYNVTASSTGYVTQTKTGQRITNVAGTTINFSLQQSDISTGGDTLGNAHPYPSFANLSRGDKINFAGITPNAELRIFTPAGNLVQTLKADAYGVVPGWDGSVEGGGKAGSGTYIVRVSDGKGNRKTIKILLLR